MSDNDLIRRADVLAWLSDEADNCDDAVKWGGARKYIADCKAAAYALRNAKHHLGGIRPASLAASPEVQALIAEAVARERERCAAIAGDYSAALTVEAKLWLKDKMPHAANAAAAQATAGERIAAAIRASGEGER